MCFFLQAREDISSPVSLLSADLSLRVGGLLLLVTFVVSAVAVASVVAIVDVFVVVWCCCCYLQP